MRVGTQLGLASICALLALRCSSFESASNPGDGGVDAEADGAASDASAPRLVLKAPPLVIGRLSKTVSFTIDVVREGFTGEAIVTVTSPTPDAPLSSPAEVKVPADSTKATFDLTIQANAKPTIDDLPIKVTATAGDKSAALSVPLAIWGPSGTIDPSFGDNGYVLGPEGDGGALTTQKTGHIVIAGTAASTKYFLVARYTSRGVPDAAFGGGGQKIVDIDGSEQVARVFARPDDRILVVGHTATRTAIVQLDPAGGIDQTFGDKGKIGTTFGRTSATAYGAALGADGKLTLVGELAAPPQTDSFVARILADGSPDTSIDPSGAKTFTEDPLRDFYRDVLLVDVANESRIVVLGVALRSGGASGFVTRFTSSVDVDSTYTATQFPSSLAFVIGRQPDGHLITVDEDYVRSLTANGASETTFGSNGVKQIGNNSCRAMVVESDGSILLAQSFGESTALLRRFSAKGEDVPSFGIAKAGTVPLNPPATQGVTPTGLALDRDGKILVTGTAANAVPTKRMFVARFFP